MAAEEYTRHTGLVGSFRVDMKHDPLHRLLGTDQETRAAVLLTFCDPFPGDRCSVLRDLSGSQWRRLLTWLDTSGLALYFLDRVFELRRSEMLPPDVLGRLQQNLRDNTERTLEMIAESNAIHREFQGKGLSYAAVKGFTLWPCSVPNPCLRSQLDLDFLIAESSAFSARRILESRGYYLHASCGSSLEFKTRHLPGGSLKDLYKALPFRSVELHLASGESRSSLLQRKKELEFHGVPMPVLSPADLFVGQGLHLAKHICSEFFRTAHLIEFWRHIVARRDDDAFWKEVRAAARHNSNAPVALGLATLLITQLMGEFAPEALTCWTVDCLPVSVRLWVELYGRRCALGSFPGNKLYVLLQEELELLELLPKRALRRKLMPMTLPPALFRGKPDEGLTDRAQRYRLQLRLIFFRLRFHSVEGLRYMYESFHWRRQRGRLA